MVTGALIAATVASAAISASASKKAGGQQADAAKKDLALQREIFETTEANQAPFIEGGQQALQGLLFELGLGDAPEIGGTPQFQVGERQFDTRDAADQFLKLERDRVVDANRPRPSFVVNERDGGFDIAASRAQTLESLAAARGNTILPSGFNPFDLQVEDISTPGRLFEGFQESPGFKFAKAQGISAVDASASASGSLFSGSTLQALNEFGQNFAGLARGTFLDRLANVAGAGQGAVNQLSQSAAQFGQGASQALSGIGNARAAGTIGQANAINSGLNSLTTIIGGGLGGGIGG